MEMVEFRSIIIKEWISLNHHFFIISDDTPHVPNEDLGEQSVLSIISNLTYIIRQVFPCKYPFLYNIITKLVN